MEAKHLTLLHVAKGKLKLQDEDYRAILQRVAGVSSARELDQVGFAAVMEEFRRLGFKSEWRKKTGGYRPGMATPSQIVFMNGLWLEYRGCEDEAGFRAWLEHYHHVSNVRFLTSRAAYRVIAGLKAMSGRKKAATANAGATPTG